MKHGNLVGSLGMVLAAIAMTACTTTESDTEAPAFPEGTGQVAHPVAYPAGPYGISKSSIIRNYSFVGFSDAKTATSSMQQIQLADFYNPHAFDKTYNPASADEDDRRFPPGSQYGAGELKPTVLHIDVASVWCGPCNEEAKTLLPVKHTSYKPCGGEILLQLADGPTPGTAATPQNLINWTKKYGVDFPATIDPSYKLSSLFEADAYPANMIIDLTTMEMVDVLAGEPVDGDPFWDHLEAHLDKTRPGCTVK